MANQSLLQKVATKQIYERGKRFDWWPYGSHEQWEAYVRDQGIALRGNAEHIVVGLDSDGQLVVQEIHGIADTAKVTVDAFIVACRTLYEEVINESVN